VPWSPRPFTRNNVWRKDSFANQEPGDVTESTFLTKDSVDTNLLDDILET
jgi:hypothetical protein